MGLISAFCGTKIISRIGKVNRGRQNGSGVVNCRGCRFTSVTTTTPDPFSDVLPFHHDDPFDRLLVAQALSESIPIVSADTQLDLYGVQRFW
ncbi:MAG: hypothetical protein EXS05_10360 [Planctomycetaceae bacterium]|nr:hypothetical protein [Planctomycetaceae bacterium]